jgi:hypothetical protein
MGSPSQRNEQAKIDYIAAVEETTEASPAGTGCPNLIPISLLSVMTGGCDWRNVKPTCAPASGRRGQPNLEENRMITGFQKALRSRTSRAAALSIVLALAMLPIASTAAAKEQVPFKGTLQAFESGVFNPGPPPTLSLTGAGSGNATHLGRFTYSYTVVININPDNSGTGTLYYDFVAANGDHLYSVGDGVGVAVEGMPGTIHIVEAHTITGGTGRFAEATGQFTVDRLASGVVSGTFDGYIVLAH